MQVTDDMVLAAAKIINPRAFDEAAYNASHGFGDPSREAAINLAMTKAREAINAAMSAMRPTHRHIMRGSQYTEIGRGFAQVSIHPIEEMTAVVIYRGIKGGPYWVRNAVEFDDGRFEIL